MISKPWTRRQSQFVLHLLADRNRDATAAAIKAGYSPRSARNQAHRMMTDDDYSHVQNKIREEAEKMSERFGLSADKVLQEIVAVASGNIGDFIKVGSNGLPRIDLENVTKADLRALKTLSFVELFPVKSGQPGEQKAIRVTISLQDKLHALDLLMRHLNLHEKPKRTKIDDAHNIERIAALMSGEGSKHNRND